MARISLSINAVLVIAVAILFYMQFSSSSNTSDSGSTETPMATASSSPEGSAAKPISLAYIVTDSVVKNYKYYNEVLEKLEGKRSILQRELERRASGVQKEYANFMQQAQAGMLSQNQIKEGEAKIMQQQQELELYRQQELEKFMQKEADETERLNERIRTFLDKFNETKGYDYIFNYHRASGIWLANDAFDITNEVLEGLNAENVTEE